MVTEHPVPQSVPTKCLPQALLGPAQALQRGQAGPLAVQGLLQLSVPGPDWPQAIGFVGVQVVAVHMQEGPLAVQEFPQLLSVPGPV